MVTTARDFKIFKKEALRCIKLWRITGWRIEFDHKQINSRAQYLGDAINHVCMITLSKYWLNDVITDRKIKSAARHEVIHCLLDELDEVGQLRFVTRDQHTHALESVTRHLEELLP